MSNSLLDVDESIMTRNLLLPGNKEDDNFGELLKNLNKPERPSVTVRPTPGSCIKVRTESGQKVFLNICQTTEIPAPEIITDAQLLDVMEDKTPSNYRIPMSIGMERMETDKSGEPAPTYDIAMNPEFYKKCTENKLFWAFMITVVIGGVSEKYDKRINPERYVVLKNRKAMGKLQEHRIEKREVNKAMRKPLIQVLEDRDFIPSELETERIEMSGISSSSSSSNEKSFTSSKAINNKKPEFRILREPKDGNVVEKLIGQFKVPNIHSVKDLAVDVGEDRIIVESHRTNYLVDIFIPYSIEQEKVIALLDKNDGILTLNMPVIKC